MGDTEPAGLLRGHHSTDAKVCAADQEPFPCQQVRAFHAGCTSGLAEAATTVQRFADRQTVPARYDLLVRVRDTVRAMADEARARMNGGSPDHRAGVGMFGLDPVVHPPFEVVARFVEEQVARRGRRAGPAKDGEDR